jgi:predicted Zn-dependent protease
MKAFRLCAAVFLLATGCASSAVAPAASTPQAELARVRQAVDRLTVAAGTAPVRVRLSNSPGAAAYAWPDGTVLLSRGLVRMLDEDELAAVVAHELGHLLARGHLRTVAALGGARSAVDVEAAADAAGVRLLAQAGYPAGAMARMLEKVAGARGMSPACRARLIERVRRLRG